MKVEIEGRYATIKESTSEEILSLVEKLTWDNTNPNSNTAPFFIPPQRRLTALPFVPVGDLPIKEKTKKEEKPLFTSLLFRDQNNDLYFFANLLLTLQQYSELNLQFDKTKLNLPKKSDLKINPNILDNITLRDYQVSAINKVLAYKNGVFHGATGFGKTAVIIALAKFYLEQNLAKRVLIITPNLATTDNMLARFKSHNLDNLVSGAGGSFALADTPIVVGNINTVYRAMKYKKGDVYDIIKNTDMMMYDECHHASAYTSFRTAVMIDPKYLYGFSGTPYREEGNISCYEDGLIHSLFGPTMVSVPTRYLIKKGYLAQPYVFMKPVGSKGKYYNSPYIQIYNRFILNNAKRNDYIATYAQLFIKQKLKTLILVQRLCHIEMLLRLLKNFSVIGISGSNTGKIVDPRTGIIEEFTCSYEQAWADLESGKYDAAIASVVADEGVDIPSVGALIIGGSGKSIIRAYQRTGRGLRSKSDGANIVFVLDFDDEGHPFVKSHSKQRLGHYQDMGAIMVNESQFLQMLMDSRSFDQSGNSDDNS